MKIGKIERRIHAYKLPIVCLQNCIAITLKAQCVLGHPILNPLLLTIVGPLAVQDHLVYQKIMIQDA